MGGGERQALGEASEQRSTRGMPLGNLTSQFFANIYLNELDQFVKHMLKAKYYIRYVDDFVILHSSRAQLKEWEERIRVFLQEKLLLTLHEQKSRIIPLARGIDFVGFRIFYHYRLVRKRNIRRMMRKVSALEADELSYWNLMKSYQGWQAYVKWANSFKLRKRVLQTIQRIKKERLAKQNNQEEQDNQYAGGI